MTHTFPKARRLCTKSQFSHVFNHGRKVAQNFGAIFFYPNNLDHARLGVVITNKNINRSVKRHMFKRVIRESFRINQQLFPGIDIVVFLYARTNTFTKGELRLCLEKQWQRLIGSLPK